jgi:hypothetical protein
MSEAVQQRGMTEGRALLTEREKEALAGDGSDSYRYKTRTYFRSRLEKLERDVEMLAEHDPELLDELRDVVCAGVESAAHTAGERSASQDDRDTTPDDERRAAGAHADSGGAHDHALADLVDAVADEVLPGSGEKLAARREALYAVVGYLREHGTATPSDFKTDVYPDHPARYTDGEDPPNSWWNNSMYPGLSALAERSDAIGAADTTGKWSYTGAGGDDV